jgi:hypothetical protein
VRCGGSPTTDPNEEICIAQVNDRAQKLTKIAQKKEVVCVTAATGVGTVIILACVATTGPAFFACIGVSATSELAAGGVCIADAELEMERIEADRVFEVGQCER